MEVKQMWTEQVLQKLSDHSTYTRKDLFQMFLQEKPNLADSVFRWTLYDLQREQKLFRTDYDTYMKIKPEILPEYHPIYTDYAKGVSNSLSDRFPVYFRFWMLKKMSA